MSVVRAAAQDHGTYVLWNNVAESATVTTSSETTNGSALNAIDYYMADYWIPSSGGTHYIEFQLPSAQPVDYFFFYRQDIHSQGGTVKLQFWDGATFVDLVSTVPGGTEPEAHFFSETASDRFRVEVSSANPWRLGIVMFGKAMEIPNGLSQGFASPFNASETTNRTNETEAGNYIGRNTVKRAIPFSFGSELIEYQWLIDNWRPFVKHIEKKPFAFVWSRNVYSDEVAYCWSAEVIETPSFDDTHFSSFEVECRGVIS